MKRNVFRRSLSLLLGLLVALGMTTTVFAGEAQKGDVVFFADDVVYLGYTEGYAGVYSEGNDDAFLTSVTSSDPNVAKVFPRDGAYIIKGIAPGTVTITGNYTYRGQTGSLSVPLTVKKVPVMFKSLKVNGKKVNLTKNPFGIFKKTRKATSVKIKAKTAPGWKIKSVSAYAAKSTKTAKGYKVKVTKKMVKNGKKIKFAKKYKNMIVTIEMANTKTGERSFYQVQFYRNKPIIS